jgi:hypothetical protein
MITVLTILASAVVAAAQAVASFIGGGPIN